MIRNAYRALPGPTPVKVVLAAMVVIAGLAALHFFYDWLGWLLLDPGGAIS
ncbi:MAG TPA: hypothetical protein VLB67_11070 [Acidimicrobiia bacterium]|nr:hypothetical protein [Acidimicrobiia bacterium]